MTRLLVVALALAAAVPAYAAQAYAVSVEEVARASDAVLRGTVERSRTWKSEDGLRIYTTYDVRTRTVLRGQAPAVARVVVPGGALEGLRQSVDAAPTLAMGEDVVLFLHRDASSPPVSTEGAGAGDRFEVTGLAQGKFTVAGARARPDLSKLMFVKTNVPAGERRAEEMPLKELERRVRSTR
jgi:hypothetical protein